jgi:hypothetical protein
MAEFQKRLKNWRAKLRKNGYSDDIFSDIPAP